MNFFEIIIGGFMITIVVVTILKVLYKIFIRILIYINKKGY